MIKEEYYVKKTERSSRCTEFQQDIQKGEYSAEYHVSDSGPDLRDTGGAGGVDLLLRGAVHYRLRLPPDSKDYIPGWIRLPAEAGGVDHQGAGRVPVCYDCGNRPWNASHHTDGLCFIQTGLQTEWISDHAGFHSYGI